MDNPIYTVSHFYNGIFTNLRITSSLQLTSSATFDFGPRLRFSDGVTTFPSIIGTAIAPNDIFLGSSVGDVCILAPAKNILLGGTSTIPALTLTTENRVCVLETITATGGDNPRFQSLVGTDELLVGTASEVHGFFSDAAIGDSAIRSSRNLIIGSLDNTVFSTFIRNTLSCQILRRLPSSAMFTLPVLSPLPDNTDTLVTGWVLQQSSGDQLDFEEGGRFRNTLHRTIAVTVSYSANRESSLLGKTAFWFELSDFVGRWGYQEVTDITETSGTATFTMNPDDVFQLMAFQDSGEENNVQINSRLSYVIY